MSASLRHYTAMAEQAGLRVDRVAQGKHYKLYVTTRDGRLAVVMAPRTGSDWRGDKNKLAQMRAIAEGRQ